MKRINGFIFIGCILFASPLFALRCDRKIIESGDTKQYVFDFCGEPDSVNSFREMRSIVNQSTITQYGYDNYQQFPNSAINSGQAYNQTIEVLVDEWVYDFGRSRLRQLLRFENGRLMTITDLERGYRR